MQETTLNKVPQNSNGTDYVGDVKFGEAVDANRKSENKPLPILYKPRPIKGGAKIGRNDMCPCGSGKKYKKCCLFKQMVAEAHKEESI